MEDNDGLQIYEQENTVVRMNVYILKPETTTCKLQS